VKGTIFLILGFYSFCGSTSLSIIFSRVIEPCIPTPSGTYCAPLDPANYWNMWFMQYGWSTILNALIGLAFIIIGSRYFVYKKELSKSENFIS